MHGAVAVTMTVAHDRGRNADDDHMFDVLYGENIAMPIADDKNIKYSIHAPVSSIVTRVRRIAGPTDVRVVADGGGTGETLNSRFVGVSSPSSGG